jgi:Ca2+-binding RTX toxin-like protein
MERRAFGAGASVAVLLTAGLMSGCEPVGGTVRPIGDSNNISFAAAEGQDNELTITLVGGDLIITDLADEVIPVGRCSAINDHSVRCPPLGTAPFAVRVSLGDGNDEATNDSSVTAGMNGEAGNDTLEGGSGTDSLIGEEGLDVLSGNGGDDRLEDGSPNILDVDVFNGGAGIDEMRYSFGSGALTIDLDGAADDGLPGESDRVGADVENIVGSDFGDRLTGNARPNRFLGNKGDDVLIGLAGFDELDGGVGTDTCEVGRGGGSTNSCEA